MKREKTVFMKWVSSYFIILLIPFIIALATYFFTYQRTTNQAVRVYQTLTKQIQNDIDNKIAGAYKTLNDLKLSIPVRKLISPARYSALNPYLYYEVVQALSKQVVTDEYIETAFVYLSDSHRIISNEGNWDATEYFDFYYSQGPLSNAEYLKSLASKEQKKASIFKYSKYDAHHIIFTQSWSFGGQDTVKATVGVVMNQEQLTQRMMDARWDEGVSAYLVTEEKDVLLSASNRQTNDLEGVSLTSEDSIEYVQMDGEKSAVTRQESAYNSWQYLLITPDRLIKENAMQVQKFTFIGLFLSAIVGLFFALRFSRSHYRPLQQIIDTFPTEDTPHAAKNEYVWLEEASIFYRDKLEETEDLLGVHNRRIRDYILVRLLESPFNSKRDAGDMKRFNIRFPDAFNMVAFVVFDEEQGLVFSNDVEKGRATLVFSLMNLFQELLGKQYVVEIIDMGSSVAMIINLVDVKESTTENLRSSFLFAVDTLQTQLGTTTSVAFGEAHRGVQGIYLSALEARETLEYLPLMKRKESQLLNFSDVKENRQGYEYPPEVEQKIVNAISTGNVEEATRQTKEVFLINEQRVAGEIKRTLMFDVFGTIIKGIHQSGHPAVLGDLKFSRDMVENSAELVQVVHDITEEIFNSQSSQTSQKQLSGEIERFVLSEYNNPMLNVAHIGEYFTMTPSYLSSLYFEETGQYLSDFINVTRIKKAKEYLDEGKSVSDTANMVGFSNSNTLIRVFKKHEGITPGQYKNLV